MLASLDPPGAVRVEGDALQPALDAAAPLLERLHAEAAAALARRHPPTPPDELVRVAPGAALAADWSLVLMAMGVPHTLAPTEDGSGGVALLAPTPRAAEARAALDAYEVENAPQPSPPREPDYGETAMGLCFALAVLGAYAAQERLRGVAQWLARGASDAEAVLRGEWWRTATALTLHEDAAHALGNAVAGAVAMRLLARRLGPGPAAWVALASGVLGNALTALSHRRDFISIGASTAVFGLLGALAGTQLAPPRRGPRARPWVVLGASVALLGLLGTSARSDLLAHLFGMGVGLLLGAATGALVRRPPRRTAWQPAAAAATLIALAACWALALRA
jgi:membrane associated rhomboid family serine protease